MADSTLATLLPALDIAAFTRLDDGTFRSLAPPPAWFGRLGRDGTFHFLGHILEEAGAFWKGGSEGSQDWGPCADIDEHGHEFHYKVKALRLAGHDLLVFQLDDAAERMREVLQKVRSQALEAERHQD